MALRVPAAWSSWGERYVLDVRSIVVTAIWAFGITFVVSALILPGFVDLLPFLPDAVGLLALILLTSACRIAAGVFGARRFGEEVDAVRRVEALPSAAVGGALGWALLVLFSVVTGVAELELLLLLDVLRWSGEAMVGALLVDPRSRLDRKDSHAW
jgi:hypothetical protein